ncbi:MAG: hypothetical protein JSS14_22110 [Proteobacteria bacterium]|nr:hypothetical protein [Pseudomonadota bacterium]
MMKRPIKWSDGMSAAFVKWRQTNQRAYTYGFVDCLYNDEILTEFEQWYATQRLLGAPLPKVKE